MFAYQQPKETRIQMFDAAYFALSIARKPRRIQAREISVLRSMFNSIGKIEEGDKLCNEIRKAVVANNIKTRYIFVLPIYHGSHGVETSDDCGDPMMVSNYMCRLYHKRIIRD